MPHGFFMAGARSSSRRYVSTAAVMSCSLCSRRCLDERAGALLVLLACQIELSLQVSARSRSSPFCTKRRSSARKAVKLPALSPSASFHAAMASSGFPIASSQMAAMRA